MPWIIFQPRFCTCMWMATRSLVRKILRKLLDGISCAEDEDGRIWEWEVYLELQRVYTCHWGGELHFVISGPWPSSHRAALQNSKAMSSRSLQTTLKTPFENPAECHGKTDAKDTGMHVQYSKFTEDNAPAVMQLITLSNSDYSYIWPSIDSHIYIDAISIDSPNGIPDDSFLRRDGVVKWSSFIFLYASPSSHVLIFSLII